MALTNNRKVSIRYDPETNEFLKISLKHLENDYKSHIPSYIENDYLIQFYKKGEIVLIDKNLYSNYASKLIPNVPFSHKDSLSILLETKNESLHLLQNEFNYNSISKFIQDHLLNLNNRYTRFQEITKKEFSNIIDVDVKRLNLILGAEKSEWQINDLLIFFYNNWCGFCKSLNFNLIDLMENYFSSVDTFKLIKVNVQENDLPFNLYMQNIPALLFIPANSTLKESIIYDYHENYLDKKNILSFILTNSYNMNTLKQFFTSNVLNNNKIKSSTQKSKLRYNFINLVEKKIKGMEINLSMNFDKHKSHSDYEANLFYLKSIKLKEEIYILKEFQSLFNKKIT